MAVLDVSVIDAERIKLASVRSPWWCAGVAALGTAALGTLIAFSGAEEGGQPMGVGSTQFAYVVGMAIVMVMATLTVTSEYSVGTMRTTFLAVPRRGVALVAKTVVVATLSAVVGLVAAFGSWALSSLLLPGVDLALAGPDQWRQVAGVGLVYVLASVIAVAVGILVRHTAGAVALVLVWSLMAEKLVQLIPGLGPAVQQWLPFEAAKYFLTSGDAGPGPAPWFAAAYVAAIAMVLLTVAIGVAKRRDA